MGSVRVSFGERCDFSRVFRSLFVESVPTQ